MKKLIIPAILIFSCLMLTGCGSSYIKDTNYKEINKLITDKEDFILEVMSTNCSACKDFEPKLKEVANEYKITILKLDIKDLKDEEWVTLRDTYSLSGTPTTMFFTKGEEVSISTRMDGNISKDKIISKLKAMGYIK
ncbi:MAG: thioredoxin family protein [Bacilli bacterium]